MRKHGRHSTLEGLVQAAKKAAQPLFGSVGLRIVPCDEPPEPRIGALCNLPVHDQSGAYLGTVELDFAGRSIPDDVQDRAAGLVAMVAMAWSEMRARSAAQIAERRAREEAIILRQRANTDHLTGLQNARAFEAAVKTRMSARGHSLALIVLDLDGFKGINDLYGHSFGNRYLACIGQSLRRALSPSAVIGRIGGDEFAICVPMPDGTGQFLPGLMSKLQGALIHGVATFGKSGLGRVSMGASMCPLQADTYDELFELADAALYASKRTRRGVCTVFDPAKHQRFDSREMHASFTKALDDGQIVPFFQPIVDLETQENVGYEVLARWIGPLGDLRCPGDFASVLTEESMAERLTRHIAGAALALKSSGAVPARVKLSFNLTSMDLANPDFVFDFGDLLARHGQSWDRIVFEVTETTMLDNQRDQTFRTLSELRRRGAKVGLDDFGTGFGSLTHLGSWPVDIIKIDRSFVADVTSNPRHEVLIAAILSIAELAGFTVVGEGIETEQQRVLLAHMGCRYGQGYLFSEPTALGDIGPVAGALQAPAAVAGE